MMKACFKIVRGLCCSVLIVCTLVLLQDPLSLLLSKRDDGYAGYGHSVVTSARGGSHTHRATDAIHGVDVDVDNNMRKTGSSRTSEHLGRQKVVRLVQNCRTLTDLQHWHEKAGFDRGCPARSALLDRLARGLPAADECEYGSSNSPRYENCFIRAIALMSFGPVDSPASNPYWTEHTDAMSNLLCHEDTKRCRETKDCMHNVLQQWWQYKPYSLYFAGRTLHLVSPDAHAVDNKWSQVTLFRRLGLKQPGVIYAGEAPGYSERHRPDDGYPPPPAFDAAALTAAITALPQKDFVIKPLNCWQSNGIKVVTDEAWRAGYVTMSTVVQYARNATKKRCKWTSAYACSGGRNWVPPGSAGVGVFELFKTRLHYPGAISKATFLFELRVFVAGGLMYGALHSHTANAHRGNKPRYYIFPDGASGWSGCQHTEHRASHDRCMAHLRKTEPSRLPGQVGVAEWIDKEAQARLPELKRESERVARELGASFVRVDWFVDINGLVINELGLVSALELPGKSTKLFPMLFAGNVLHQQRLSQPSTHTHTSKHSSL